MKFKIGDRVKTVRAMNDSDITNKSTCIEKIFTITKANSSLKYPYELDGLAGQWCDEELELVDPTFTKADLKDGMVVEFRCGLTGMVMNNRIFGLEGGVELEDYYNNLEPINHLTDDFCIDKIYTSSSIWLSTYLDKKYLTLIWERPKEYPHKEMTIEEIEKELGYKMKIVLDKELIQRLINLDFFVNL